jgi:hypothetical protein
VVVVVVEEVGRGVVVVSAVETVVVSVVVDTVVSVVVVVASVEVDVNADESSAATSRNDATPTRPHIVEPLWAASRSLTRGIDRRMAAAAPASV